MPLLKGGPVGLAGTAPMVFTAAKVMQKVQPEGETAAGEWKGLLEQDLGCSIDEFMEMMREAIWYIFAEIKCCRCSK